MEDINRGRGKFFIIKKKKLPNTEAMLLDLQPVFMELFCTPNGISEPLGIQRKPAITHFNTTYQQLNMKI